MRIGFFTFCPCFTPEEITKENTKMNSPVERSVILNPYTNQPLNNNDFVIDSPETVSFRQNIEKCKEEGVDTDFMERTLNTCLRSNRELYEQKVAEDAFEKKRRENENGSCAIQ